MDAASYINIFREIRQVLKIKQKELTDFAKTKIGDKEFSQKFLMICNSLYLSEIDVQDIYEAVHEFHEYLSENNKSSTEDLSSFMIKLEALKSLGVYMSTGMHDVTAIQKKITLEPGLYKEETEKNWMIELWNKAMERDSIAESLSSTERIPARSTSLEHHFGQLTGRNPTDLENIMLKQAFRVSADDHSLTGTSEFVGEKLIAEIHKNFFV